MIDTDWDSCFQSYLWMSSVSNILNRRQSLVENMSFSGTKSYHGFLGVDVIVWVFVVVFAAVLWNRLFFLHFFYLLISQIHQYKEGIMKDFVILRITNLSVQLSVITVSTTHGKNGAQEPESLKIYTFFFYSSVFYYLSDKLVINWFLFYSCMSKLIQSRRRKSRHFTVQNYRFLDEDHRQLVKCASLFSSRLRTNTNKKLSISLSFCGH